jgi:hypothetical protein
MQKGERFILAHGFIGFSPWSLGLHCSWATERQEHHGREQVLEQNSSLHGGQKAEPHRKGQDKVSFQGMLPGT